MANMTSYYLLLMIAGAFLAVHADEDIAKRDIKQGFLVGYLLRPISYIRMKFLDEIPWRLIQGSFGLITFIAGLMVFHVRVSLVSGWEEIIMATAITLLAYALSFLWSMIMGLTALWVIEYSGIHELSKVITIILAGYLVPVDFLPSGIRTAAEILPFSYMAYYPIRAAQGLISLHDAFGIIGVQICWIIGFYWCYRFMWARGIRRFTGVGQ